MPKEGGDGSGGGGLKCLRLCLWRGKQKTSFPERLQMLPKKGIRDQNWSHKHKNILSRRKKKQRNPRKLDVNVFLHDLPFPTPPQPLLSRCFFSCPPFLSPPPFPGSLSLSMHSRTRAVLNQHFHKPLTKKRPKTNAVTGQSTQQNSHHFWTQRSGGESRSSQAFPPAHQNGDPGQLPQERATLAQGKIQRTLGKRFLRKLSSRATKQYFKQINFS